MLRQRQIAERCRNAGACLIAKSGKSRILKVDDIEATFGPEAGNGGGGCSRKRHRRRSPGFWLNFGNYSAASTLAWLDHLRLRHLTLTQTAQAVGNLRGVVCLVLTCLGL